MPPKENIVQNGINMVLHAIILLSFLTILYFRVIEPQTQKILNKKFSEMIAKTGTDTLQQIDKDDTNNIINWNVATAIAQKYKLLAQGKDPEVENINKKIYWNIILTIIILTVILIVAILFFKYIKGYKLNLGEIILENLVAFSFIGFLEFYFFKNTASQYVPAMPSQIMVDVMSRLKYQVDKIFT